MSELEKAARMALAVLESWQQPSESLLDGHHWPICWTQAGTVSVTLVPRVLKNNYRAPALLNVEMLELGRQHNMAINLLREALIFNAMDNAMERMVEKITRDIWGGE